MVYFSLPNWTVSPWTLFLIHLLSLSCFCKRSCISCFQIQSIFDINSILYEFMPEIHVFMIIFLSSITDQEENKTDECQLSQRYEHQDGEWYMVIGELLNIKIMSAKNCDWNMYEFMFFLFLSNQKCEKHKYDDC